MNTQTTTPANSFAQPESYNQYLAQSHACTVEDAFLKDVPIDPIDALNSVLDRADATLHLIEGDGEDLEQGFALCHRLVMASLDAVHGYVAQAKTLVDYWHESDRNTLRTRSRTFHDVKEKIIQSEPNAKGFMVAIDFLMSFDDGMGEEIRTLFKNAPDHATLKAQVIEVLGRV